MKILTVFTGGTIGSTVSDGWISPDPSAKYLLISKFRELSGISVTFDVLSPYTVLSENLSADELNQLIACVTENLDKGYDGIIVTHGTDSIQYSAAALALALGSDTIPVMLVSSNYPLEDDRANGLANFTAAVQFIASKSGRGVFVSYKNHENRVNIHAGNALLTASEFSDEIYSSGEVFACYENGKIIPNPSCQGRTETTALGRFELIRDSGILVVPVHPGDGYSYHLADKKAVILRPYHSGTLSTDIPAFHKFCMDAKEHGIPVFLVNAPSGTTYSSVKLYRELGIIPLELPFVFAYMKIWATISLYGIEEFLKYLR